VTANEQILTDGPRPISGIADRHGTLTAPGSPAVQRRGRMTAGPRPMRVEHWMPGEAAKAFRREVGGGEGAPAISAGARVSGA
jgi:hypothetical protein